MKKPKYVSSNLGNRFSVQAARLRQNSAYLPGRDRGREALAVNHSFVLPALGTRTEPLCLVARAPDHKSTLVCRQTWALLPRGAKLPAGQSELTHACPTALLKCQAARSPLAQTDLTAPPAPARQLSSSFPACGRSALALVLVPAWSQLRFIPGAASLHGLAPLAPQSALCCVIVFISASSRPRGKALMTPALAR